MKLSLDALKNRAEATASTELLATISGGTLNDCHDTPTVGSILLQPTTTLTPNPGTLTPTTPIYTLPEGGLRIPLN